MPVPRADAGARLELCDLSRVPGGQVPGYVTYSDPIRPIHQVRHRRSAPTFQRSRHRRSAPTFQGSTRTSKVDLLVFYGIPLAVAAISILFQFNLKNELTQLLVNFGSILTALLLSVLVLVYDQEAKIRTESAGSNSIHPLQNVKKRLLRQLYFNICYAIILSVALAFVCFVHSSVDGLVAKPGIPFTEYELRFNFGAYLTTPIALLVAMNIVLTVLMIVKRLHVLLTSE